MPTIALSRVLLTSGRPVDLTELRLSSTYGGVLEGYPCKPLNDLAIAGLVAGPPNTPTRASRCI
ncbi:hypothetical protein SALBM217S_09249 [Streptomyces griseoloalbus]